MQLEIAPGKFIGTQCPCFIIAEIGQNHQGDINEAQRLIDAAHLAGADCVKLQKTSLLDKFTKSALQRPYSTQHSWGNTYEQHKAYLEFSEEDFESLKSYAEKRGILFSASAKDCKSLEFLLKLNVPFIKIGSGDSDDHFLLRAAAESGKPLIISTGMQDMKSVRQVYETVQQYHNKFALLQCVSSYPTNYEDINLRVIQTYRNEFPDILIGYSGHEIGTAVPVAAVALGAKIVEKHITLDKNQKGNDHQCSMLPQEFRTMVDGIRMVERSLGHGIKNFTSSEMPCYNKLGKSIVAAKDLKKGITIQEQDLKIKVSQPNGIPAKEFHNVIGARLLRNIECDEQLFTEDVNILQVTSLIDEIILI